MKHTATPLKYMGLFTIIGFLLVAIFYLPLIMQEGNPIPMAYGAYKLVTTEDSYIRVDEFKYMVKAEQGGEDKLLAYLSSKDLTFTDRGGSVLFFKNKNGRSYTATARMYTRSFEILDFTNQSEQNFKLP